MMRKNKIKIRPIKQKKIRELLRKFRSDDHNEVFEAGTTIYQFDNVPISPLISILDKFPNALNREYAAYGLIPVLQELELKQFYRSYHHKNSVRSFEVAKENRRKIDKIIKVLIKTIESDESPKVKAQALETIGMSSTAGKKYYKLRGLIERCVVKALSSEFAEVRFWACYAAGQLKIKNALPKLREMVKNDTEDWGNWWYISEEAEDAIDWIHGRDTEGRIPLIGRENTQNKENQSS